MTGIRGSRRVRQQQWYGLKPRMKSVLSMRVANKFLAVAARRLPGFLGIGRLPVARSVSEVEGRVDGASFVMLNPNRCVVAKELYWGGGSRPGPADSFALTVFAKLAREADVAIDIGAYTGIFTLVATAVNRRITAYAFEIVPAVYQLLVDNCARNEVLARTRCFPCGIGRPDASITVPDGRGGSALPSFYSSRLEFEQGVEVRFRSLDSFSEELGQAERVIMKVDVEGTETEVFRHGLEFLDRFRPDILCEVLAGVADPRSLEQSLSPFGYNFYLVGDRNLFRSRHVVPRTGYRDWFFTTRPESDLRSQGIEVPEPVS